jgi:L-threonylcarbamoyladenylate synthase
MHNPTLMWRIDPSRPDPALLTEAAARLLRGELVAFPTETVYGLGANAFDAEAVQRIFAAKGRPFSDPLIVHVASADEVGMVAADFPADARRLAEAFWPGPLTLLLPRHPALPAEVTAGLTAVAVRVPRHPVALGLLRACGFPLAAPSANRFGHTSPTTANHVQADLEGMVHVILDAGSTPVGIESTVLDLQTTPAVILRPGGVTREQLQAVIGEVALAAPAERLAASPGRQPRHYAPRAELVLMTGGTPADIATQMIRRAHQLSSAGRVVGVLATSEVCRELSAPPGPLFDLGSQDDVLGIARRLFLGLRTLEGAPVDVILAHLVPPQGMGLAINDRLQRAARPAD